MAALVARDVAQVMTGACALLAEGDSATARHSLQIFVADQVRLFGTSQSAAMYELLRVAMWLAVRMADGEPERFRELCRTLAMMEAAHDEEQS